MVEKVRAWLERHGGPGAGDPVVVGCSGGGDSSALLLSLAELELGPLTAVYVDHGLRDGTSAEADRVAALAARCGARFERARVQVSRRKNLLARAREARYLALAEAAARIGARFVAVGHTASDQAETILWRAERGDPAPALAGIPPLRVLDGGVTLIRPLGRVLRGDAAAYARARGADPVDDPTNARPDLARTRARALLARSPGFAAALCSLGERAAELASEIARRAEALGPLDRLDAVVVAAAEPAVLAALLRRAGLFRAGRAHARALRDLAAGRAGTRSVDLGGGLIAERRYGSLRIGRPASSIERPAVACAADGSYEIGGFLARVTGCEGEPLTLRFAEPGDFARTRAGRRKLSDLWIDEKVPRPERAATPLCARGAEVLAIAHPGLARRIAPGRPRVRFSRITVGEAAPGMPLTPRRPVQ